MTLHDSGRTYTRLGQKNMGCRQMGASLRRDQVEAHRLQRWPLA
uniref:Uncharacterized protein n=1 Tax=Aegilops tauschii subsp. strangulata TaxID=200361 RepID=A0A453K815_AEGTS